jgi:hypothetical protein
MSPLKFRRSYKEIVKHTLMLEKYAHDMRVKPAFLWNKLYFCKHGNVNVGFLK